MYEREVPCIDLATAITLVADCKGDDLRDLIFHIRLVWVASNRQACIDYGVRCFGETFRAIIEMVYHATGNDREFNDLLDELNDAAYQ